MNLYDRILLYDLLTPQGWICLKVNLHAYFFFNNCTFCTINIVGTHTTGTVGTV